MYKISIIIPVFNMKDKLKTAFDSIKNQTFGFENLEIIFVDDCSTDDSVMIINEFCELYDNVKLITLDKNSGYAGKPRNVGITNASADYLMFLDPDDEYLENACEILYGNIINSKFDIVSANFLTYSQNNEKKINWNKIELKEGSIEIDSIYKQPELFLLPPSVWSKIFKKDFILNNEIIFPIGIPAQDVVFVYHSLLKAKNIKYVDIPIVRYMPGIDEDKHKSVSSTRDKNSLFGLLKAYYRAMDLFVDYEDLRSYVAIHLNFWVKQLVISKISLKEKVNLLRYAYPIFEIFKNSEGLYIRRGFGRLFHKVYQKDFIGAVNLSQFFAVQLNENFFNIYNEIKTREIFIIFDDYDYISENGNEINSLLNNEGYSVKFLNLGDVEKFNEFKLNYDTCDLIIHNIYDYYFRKFCLNQKLESNFQINKDLNIEKDGEIISENYFTSDGFNFLELSDNVKLKNRFDKLYLSFDSIYDFYIYFIEDLCLSFDKKPFLINLSNFNFEKISSLCAYKIPGENIDLFNADEINYILRNQYIQEILSTYGISFENEDLKKQNEKLKLELNSIKISKNKLNEELLQTKKSYNEIISSKSWKITKPLRKLVNYFKR